MVINKEPIAASGCISFPDQKRSWQWKLRIGRSLCLGIPDCTAVGNRLRNREGPHEERGGDGSAGAGESGEGDDCVDLITGVWEGGGSSVASIV